MSCNHLIVQILNPGSAPVAVNGFMPNTLISVKFLYTVRAEKNH